MGAGEEAERPPREKQPELLAPGSTRPPPKGPCTQGPLEEPLAFGSQGFWGPGR